MELANCGTAGVVKPRDLVYPVEASHGFRSITWHHRFTHQVSRSYPIHTCYALRRFPTPPPAPSQFQVPAIQFFFTHGSRHSQLNNRAYLHVQVPANETSFEIRRAVHRGPILYSFVGT